MTTQEILSWVLTLVKMSPEEYAVAIVEPPPWLDSPLAQEEWHRVVLRLYEMRRLWPRETLSLAAYCETFAQWRECADQVEQKEAERARTDLQTRHSWAP